MAPQIGPIPMAIENNSTTPSTPRALFWASQITMVISISVFFFECFSYNVIFLRRILPAVGKSAVVPFFRTLFNVVWALALWSYHQAHWSDPGAVPERWHEFVRNMGEALPISPARPEWQPGQATLCKKCQAPRPERAHHCVLCGVCVLRMDHHCPWINNCVGFHNHKFFLLLGVYTWLASIVALGTSLPELMRFSGVAFGWKDSSLPIGPDHLQQWEVYVFLAMGAFAAFVAMLLMSLLSTHVPLAFQNKTTIEDFYENMPNPFDQGSRTGNLAEVFGKWGPDWFFPVHPRCPTSDGVSYSTVTGRSGKQFFSSDCESPRSGDGAYMLLGEDADWEKKWKLRYKVLTPEELKAAKEEQKLSPFTPQFWACGRGTLRTAGRHGNRTAA